MTSTVPRDCLICYDELNSDNTLEYQTSADSEWLPSLFCEECTEMLQNSQFDKYCHDLASTTCAREQRALLEKGPPVNLHDKNGFPMSGDAEIFKLRKANDKQVLERFSYYCTYPFCRKFQPNSKAHC